MNIEELEEKRGNLAALLSGSFSPRFKLFLLTEYIGELDSYGNKNLIEGYLAEFIDEYLALLKIYEPTGLEPYKTELIITTLHRINGYNIFGEQKNEMTRIEQSLNRVLESLKNAILQNKPDASGQLYFPVLEYSKQTKDKSGFLEFLDIKILKSGNQKKDIFYIIPSGEKIEKRLKEQINNSWKVAVKFVGANYIKIGKYHEIFINFDKKYGEYIGNSLGLVLTLGFIQELMKIYQTRTRISISPGIAVTGGLDEAGSVIPVREEIISAKVAVAFFSTMYYLVVPKEDEEIALKNLKRLNQNYPERKLKITGVDSLEDLLNRRNIIVITKTSIPVFAAKKAYKHKYSLVLFLMLFFVSGYFLAKNYDDNPYSLDISDHILSIKNKYGNVLWQAGVNYPDNYPLTQFRINSIARLFDVNKDGKNDVIITNEHLGKKRDVSKFGRVACFDHRQKLLWQYVFRDSIATRVEKFTPYYSLSILDIKKDMPDPEILLVGQHENYYPSPLIKLRLRDGKRMGHIFWHPGGGSRGFIGDFNEDGKDELIATSISNGLERCVLYSIDYDKLKGTAPTTINYRFLNQHIADFNQYIILPKSDVNNYFKERYNVNITPPFITYNNLLFFNLAEEHLPDGSDISINYEFDRKFELKDIIIGDKFRVVRDSLVADGKIKGPYTETPEYKKYLRDQIKYWNGSKFIGINEFRPKFAKGN